MTNSIDCSICLEKLNPQNGKGHDEHLFHPICIDKWLVKQEKCPICKKELKLEKSRFFYINKYTDIVKDSVVEGHKAASYIHCIGSVSMVAFYQLFGLKGVLTTLSFSGTGNLAVTVGSALIGPMENPSSMPDLIHSAIPSYLFVAILTSFYFALFDTTKTAALPIALGALSLVGRVGAENYVLPIGMASFFSKFFSLSPIVSTALSNLTLGKSFSFPAYGIGTLFGMQIAKVASQYFESDPIGAAFGALALTTTTHLTQEFWDRWHELKFLPSNCAVEIKRLVKQIFQ